MAVGGQIGGPKVYDIGEVKDTGNQRSGFLRTSSKPLVCFFSFFLSFGWWQVAAVRRQFEDRVLPARIPVARQPRLTEEQRLQEMQLEVVDSLKEPKNQKKKLK